MENIVTKVNVVEVRDEARAFAAANTKDLAIRAHLEREMRRLTNEDNIEDAVNEAMLRLKNSTWNRVKARVREQNASASEDKLHKITAGEMERLLTNPEARNSFATTLAWIRRECAIASLNVGEFGEIETAWLLFEMIDSRSNGTSQVPWASLS